ncbi:MAG TPA: hypothetical protein VHK01_21960 [Lacipirellulaceae bacterium]|jgi:hypothetical protein|nr:hypothetical protein [Lacipirellulaceae bacterium]
MAQADLMTPPAIRVATPKARMTVYFALLIIALLALLAGCFFLWLEIGRFGGFGSVPGRVSSLERPPVLVAAAAEPHAIG